MKRLLFLLLLAPSFLYSQTGLWSWEELSSFDFLYLYSYAADSSGNMVAGCEDGLIYSNDGGVTWDRVGLDRPIRMVEASADGFFLAKSDSSIFRSVNGGRDWELVYHNQYRRIDWIAVLPDGKALKKDLNGDPEISTDGGATWMDIDRAPISARDVAIHPDGTVWAATDYGLYVWDSTTGPWRRLDNDPEKLDKIAIDREGRVVIAGDNGIWQSVDTGKSWNRMDNGLSGSKVGSLAAGEDGVYLAGTSNGLYHFNPAAGKWEVNVLSQGGWEYVGTVRAIQQPDRSIQIHALSQYRGEPGSIIMYVSSDNGTTWQEKFTTRFSASQHGPVVMGSPGVLLTTSYFTMENPSTGNQMASQWRLWRSTDNGAGWHTLRIDNGLHMHSGPYRSAKGDLLLADVRRLYRSIDDGETWIQTADTFQMPPRDIRIASDGSLYCFAGDGLFRSTDDGEHWERNPNSFYTIHGYGIGSNGVLAVATEHFWYHSTDAGATWTRSSAPETDPSWEYLQNISVAPDNAIIVTMHLGGVWRKATPTAAWQKVYHSYWEVDAFATDSSGGFYMASPRGSSVFYSSDNGLSWTPIGTDGGNSISIPEDGNVYVAGMGKILRHPVPMPASVSNEAKEHARTFDLKMLPNPLVEPGIVAFRLDRPRSVRLELIDGRGNVQSLLTETTLTEGEHHIDLSRDLPSGSYFVRLCAEDECETIQAMFVR